MPHDERTDEVGRDLMDRLRHGDREALAEVYQRWGSLVYSVALRMTRSPHDAEDIA